MFDSTSKEFSSPLKEPSFQLCLVSKGAIFNLYSCIFYVKRKKSRIFNNCARKIMQSLSGSFIVVVNLDILLLHAKKCKFQCSKKRLSLSHKKNLQNSVLKLIFVSFDSYQHSSIFVNHICYCVTKIIFTIQM